MLSLSKGGGGPCMSFSRKYSNALFVAMPSLVHPTGFSFYNFSGCHAIFIMFSSFSPPFFYTSFSSFKFPGAPYRIFLLYLLRLLWHFYLVGKVNKEHIYAQLQNLLFHSFTFPGAPYRILLLFFPWIPCHF